MCYLKERDEGGEEKAKHILKRCVGQFDMHTPFFIFAHSTRLEQFPFQGLNLCGLKVQQREQLEISQPQIVSLRTESDYTHTEKE